MLSVSRRHAAATAVPIALVLGVAALVFAQTRSYGLLGMDSYPIIVTSRVLSPADLWSTLTERLMDGYYPADFYRPLVNLSFAVDHALWGLDARGYQLSNALCFAACALALLAFLAIRPVPRAPVYAVAGVALFLFHPLQFEVVPFPPRRPELLCATFMLLALAAEAGRGWGFRLLGGCATLLALGAKETAVILPGLVFLWLLLYPEAGGPRGRFLAAGGRAVASAAPVFLYLAVRFAVLGGMGGRGPIDLQKAVDAVPGNWATLIRTVTAPSSPESWALTGLWLLLCLPLVLSAVAGRRRGADPGGARHPAVADLSFAAGWLVLLTVVYSLSKRLSPWYVTAAIVPLAIAFSGICEGYGSWLRRRSMAYRAAGVTGLAVALLAVCLSLARWSPVVRSYSLWRRATIEDARLLERFDRTLERADAGSIARLPVERKGIAPVGEEKMFRGVVLQAHYSLQAWAELRHPGRQVRVLKNRRPLKTEPLRPTEVVVILDRRARAERQPARGEQAPADGVARRGATGGGTP